MSAIAIPATDFLVTRDLLRRFWSKVDFFGPVCYPHLSRCWNWTGSKDQCGYGGFSVNGRGWRSHRLAKRIQKGMPLIGIVMHHCDNPSCVNPYHLSEATHLQNRHDCVRKGRHLTLHATAKSSSLFIGVDKRNSGNFRSRIRGESGMINLGTYSTERDAALAYDKAAKDKYGDCAITNQSAFPEHF